MIWGRPLSSNEVKSECYGIQFYFKQCALAISSTYWREWIADCKPGFISQHQWPTSLTLFAEWWQTFSQVQNLVASQKNGGCYSSILMYVVLKCHL